MKITNIHSYFTTRPQSLKGAWGCPIMLEDNRILGQGVDGKSDD